MRQIDQRTPRRRFQLLHRIANRQDHFEQLHDANYTLAEAATGARRAGQVKPARWSMHAGTKPTPMNTHLTARTDIVMGVVWITASPLRWKNRGKSSNMPTPKLNRSIIEAAILGFEAQKQKIDSQISELRVMLGGGTDAPAAAAEPATPKRRKMSAAARKRMSMPGFLSFAVSFVNC